MPQETSNFTGDHLDSLDQLLAIMTSGVASIKEAYARADAPLPDLNEPYIYHPVEESVASTTMLVVAAAAQLISTLRNPGQLIIENSYATALRSAALATVMMTHIPELIREAGPKGAKVDELCAPTSSNPAKIGRLLRLLASRHIFREVEPDVFVHNRLSCVLDTGKTSKDILAKPISKYQGAGGIASLVEFCAEDGLRGAALIPACMLDPVWSASDKQEHAPVCRALNHAGNIYDFYATPGNEYAHIRFQESMTVHGKLHPARATLNGFPWADLAPGSLVIDVGGGVGSAVLTLLLEHPHLKFAVQDLPAAIADARIFWYREHLEVIEKGQVLLQEQDFFQEQLPQGASVFILRYITHNWSTECNRIILRRLAIVAEPDTRVVIIDHIVPYTSTTKINDDDVPGSQGFMAPAPLLSSAGSEAVFDIDVLMLTLFNAQERTVDDFKKMIQGTGWVLSHIYRGMPGAPSHIILTPSVLV